MSAMVAVPVEKLDDDALRSALMKQGIQVGPIVGSTRQFYRKKLGQCLQPGSEEEESGEEGPGEEGSGEEGSGEEEAGGEEEVEKEAGDEEEGEKEAGEEEDAEEEGRIYQEDEDEFEEEEEQPSAIVKATPPVRSQRKTSTWGLRQRLLLDEARLQLEQVEESPGAAQEWGSRSRGETERTPGHGPRCGRSTRLNPTRCEAPRSSSPAPAPVCLQEEVAGSSILTKLVKVVVLGLVLAALALLLTSHQEEVVEVVEQEVKVGEEEVMDWTGIFDRVRNDEEL